jgi:hypothetical protein
VNNYTRQALPALWPEPACREKQPEVDCHRARPAPVSKFRSFSGCAPMWPYRLLRRANIRIRIFRRFSPEPAPYRARRILKPRSDVHMLQHIAAAPLRFLTSAAESERPSRTWKARTQCRSSRQPPERAGCVRSYIQRSSFGAHPGRARPDQRPGIVSADTKRTPRWAGLRM